MRSNSAARIRFENSSTASTTSTAKTTTKATIKARPSGLATVIDAMARQARDTLRQQAAAIVALSERVDERFAQAVRLLHGVRGHVIVTGLGKSGHIGRKMAATFASTGTPSFFMHTTEALHGDLGMVTADDAVLLISYSGETEELIQLLPHLRARQVPTVALVGSPQSRLARAVDIALDVSVEREVCPHNLAPTSSTLAALAMGDALAVALMRMRSFDEEAFARLHPGGGLGRRLTRASDAAIQDGLVILPLDAPVSECLLSLSASDLGIALVRDEGEHIVGIITAIELQRAMTGVEGCLRAPVRDIMNRNLPLVDGDVPLDRAERMLEESNIPALIVTDAEGLPCGLLPRARRR